MKFKAFLFFLTCLLIISCVPETSQATSQKKPSILIIYNISAPTEQTTIHRIDALFSSYGDTTVKPLTALTKKQVQRASTIIYIGMSETKISEKQREWIEDFPHRKLFIGYNANQFEAFQALRFQGNSNLVQIGTKTLSNRIPFLKIKSPYKEIIQGKTLNGTYPVLIQNKKNYYLSLNKWTDEFQWYLQPYMAGKTTWYEPPKHKAWLIIDGIRPSTSPKKLKQTTDVLKKRKIPYALAVASVEYTADRKKINTLNDAKDLREALQKQQKQGIPIIANGYGLSYRTEDKVQHEFWDRQLNQPITALNSAQAKNFYSFDNFPSIEAFNKERKKIGEVEKNYTKQRIEEAVSTLARAKIYPMAFTIENDRASSYVYDEISQHFSTYFGALQYSDENAQYIGVQPLLTSPSYMNHLQVYPTNVQPVTRNLESELILNDQLRDLLKVEGSMAGMKINVQQSPKEIERTLAIFELFPQFEWLDLHTIPTKVQISHITIQQTEQGEMVVKQQWKYTDLIKNKWQTSPFEFSLWVLFGIVLLFVAVFFLNVLRLRITLKKRLFEERKPNG